MRTASIGIVIAVVAAGMPGPVAADEGEALWAQRAGGSGAANGFGVAVDPTGFTTVTGGFDGVATFGTGSNEVSLTSVGEEDGFVARYRPDGTFVWVQQIGITGEGPAYDVSIDAAGAATVVGVFSRSATFGTGDNQQTLTATGGSDVFIARYTTDGMLEWVRQAGGSGNAVGRDVAVEPGGTATITGRFDGAVTFGAGSDQVTLTSDGSDDVFVARYRANGTLEWARQAGGDQDDVGDGVAVDSAGFATVTGSIAGTATFGNNSLTSRGFVDAFIARYRPDGTVDWVRQAGGTDYDTGSSVAVDSSGAATVVGDFSGSATFGVGGSETTLDGLNDLFIARYRPDGGLVWAQKAGGPQGDGARGVAVDGTGAATVTGFIEGTSTFGMDADQRNITGQGVSDPFIARYQADGRLTWVTAVTTTGYGVGRAVAVDSTGAAMVTGSFAGSATFRPGVTLNSSGVSDIFVARYDTVPFLTSLNIAGPPSATTGTQACVTSTAADQQGRPMQGVSLSLQVTGANPGSASGSTGQDGSWQYCYTGANAGTDTVTTSAGTQAKRARITATTTVVWRASPKKALPIRVNKVAKSPVTLGRDDRAVLVGRIGTNSNGTVKVRATCRTAKKAAAGDVRFCDTKITKKGKITVVSRGYPHVRVTVRAKATPKPAHRDDWKASTWTRTWRIR